MMKKRYNFIKTIVCLIAMIITVWSCESVEDTYQEFSELGETVYIGAADSVYSVSGFKQLRVYAIITSDPKVTTGSLKSSDGTVNMEFPISKENFGKDTLEIDIPEIEAGEYRFNLFFKDTKGNVSLTREFVGTVLGESYELGLKKREISGVNYTLKNGVVGARVAFGGNVDNLSSLIITYTDRNDQQQTISVDSKSSDVDILDFKAGTTFKVKSLFAPINPFYEYSIEDETLHTFPTCDEVATVTFDKTSLDLGMVDSRQESTASFVLNSTTECLDGGVKVSISGDWMGIAASEDGEYGSSVTLTDLSENQTLYVKYAPNSQVDGSHSGTVSLSAVNGYVEGGEIAILGEEHGIPGGIQNIENLTSPTSAYSLFPDDQDVYLHGGSIEKLFDNSQAWGVHSAGNIPIPAGFFTIDLGGDFYIDEISFARRDARRQARLPKNYGYWGLPSSVDPASAVTTTPFISQPANIPTWIGESANKGWIHLGDFQSTEGSETVSNKITSFSNTKVRYLRIVIYDTYQGDVATINYADLDVFVNLDK
ncbi:MAG: DUF4998 domain-containing protein [Cyclobacteriaceae bacterium]